jgi:hypothetical protein
VCCRFDVKVGGRERGRYEIARAAISLLLGHEGILETRRKPCKFTTNLVPNLLQNSYNVFITHTHTHTHARARAQMYTLIYTCRY